MSNSLVLLFAPFVLTAAHPLRNGSALAQVNTQFTGTAGALTNEDLSNDLMDIADVLGVGSWGPDTLHSTL